MSYNPNNPNGQATSANSQPVVIASDQSPIPTTAGDTFLTGAATQTVVGNNILNSTTGTAAIDLAGIHSAIIQIVSTGTGGTFIFEGSNDNTNFQTVPVFNQLILTGTPIVAAITATNSQLIYVLPVMARYLRVRIVTTITGGSLQANSKFSGTTFTPAILQVAQSTGANLSTNAAVTGSLTTVSTVTTVGSVTSGNDAIPGIVSDVASAALTTTTTTATLTPTFGSSYQVTIPVTVVTGTTPTLDVQIQESPDSGTNWYAIYDFPRITATGSYNSPMMPLTGNRVRYVQTVSGTTPSFTRSISRLQSTMSNQAYRQSIDRTISLNTLNSTTVNLFTQSTRNAQLVVSIGAATTPPAIQLQGSDDGGATFYSIGSPLTAVANSTVSLTVTGTNSQFLRAMVTTAGVGATPNYVLVRGF